MIKIFKICFLLIVFTHHSCLALFPRESETREIKFLNGLWNFKVDNSTNRKSGFDNQWYKNPLKKLGSTQKMPVPSSYNDIVVEAEIRDFVGWVWYDREVFVPERWDDADNLRIVLRFESCSYYCIVWVNGKQLMSHEGGHLPFEAEVSQELKFGGTNLITVAVNNTLTPTTLPPGSIEYKNDTRKYPPGYFVQNIQMDFFNYAGIHRPVKFYITPTVFLLDISLGTQLDGSTGILNFKSSAAILDSDNDTVSKNDGINMKYAIIDDQGNKKAELTGENRFKGTMKVPDANFWWPVDMDEQPGYLYTLVIQVHSESSNLTDIYRLPFGFRTVKVEGSSFLINNKPFYFKGFGMHEDAVTRGKGLDLPTILRDFNLLKWIGANSFRTSHYPYADEIMDLADQRGIVVIDESPGVGIMRDNMKDENIKKHKDVMKELIHRDKNHASVVMWSVANEPETQYPEAENYFRAVISYTRELDATRPVTFVGNQSPYDDRAVQFNDVICYNKYYSWYHDMGHLEIITYQLERDLLLWHNLTSKPLIMSEYGADAVAGLHSLPSQMFTEDYQVEAVRKYFPIFDKFRGKFFIGELVWNFADFATEQDIKRVVGNKKGVFTRERQPKYIAYVLRDRYTAMSSLANNSPSMKRFHEERFDFPEDSSKRNKVQGRRGIYVDFIED